MSDNRGTIPAGTFSAADIKCRMAEREAARAAEERRHREAQEDQQKAVMAEFQKPRERTPEQPLPLIMQLVSRAADRGQTEIQVCRFPNRCAATTGPPHQQLRARLVADPGGSPGGRTRILARSPAAARLRPRGG